MKKEELKAILDGLARTQCRVPAAESEGVMTESRAKQIFMGIGVALYYAHLLYTCTAVALCILAVLAGVAATICVSLAIVSVIAGVLGLIGVGIGRGMRSGVRV